MLTKTCTKCGVCKPLDGFYKDKGCLHGVTPNCKECRKAAVKAYSETEKGKAVHAAAKAKYAATEHGKQKAAGKAASPAGRAQRAAYRITEKGRNVHRLACTQYRHSDHGKSRIKDWLSQEETQKRMRQHRRKWAKSDKGLEYAQAYRKRSVESLNDDYIRRFLFKTLGLRANEITPELIALKREQLTLRRLARQLKEAANESSKDTR
jgi:hypothetical protein